MILSDIFEKMAEKSNQDKIKIEFVNIYTDKPEVYILHNDESLAGANCPIDKTPLYSASRSSARDVWSNETLYCCPNCKEEYYPREIRNLDDAKSRRIAAKRRTLENLKTQEDSILRFLKAAGE